MSTQLTFFPWFRRGLARAIEEIAKDGAPASGSASLSAQVEFEAGGGGPISHDIQLRGPGEVVGISAGQVKRLSPAAGTLDAEYNFFPSIELADPDLPWLFSPARPDASDRLNPWLVLVVVREQDGVQLRARAADALPVLSIESPASPAAELPDLTQSWAWAHAQAAADLSDGVDAAWAATPSAFRSRLICPRRLEPGARYLAAVVPAFAAGVRAGLGPDPVVDPGAAPAWTGSESEIELPVYYSWRFGTTAGVDFEALVARLVPRVLEDVGMRDLDAGDPGGGQPESDDRILSYVGALVATEREERRWPLRDRKAVQRAIQDRLTDDVADMPVGEYEPLRDDPVVTIPRYGIRPQGMSAFPERGRPAWMTEVNLEPVHRAQAGLGGRVVRENQEELMAEAWAQAGAIRDANRLLARSRLAAEVGVRMRDRVFSLPEGSRLQFTRPLHRRLRGDEGTIAGQLRKSTLPAGAVSGAFRRVVRPGGTVSRALPAWFAETQVDNSVTVAFVEEPDRMLAYAAWLEPGAASIESSDFIDALRDAAEGESTAMRRPTRRGAPTRRSTTVTLDATMRRSALRSFSAQKRRTARVAAARQPSFAIVARDPSATPKRLQTGKLANRATANTAAPVITRLATAIDPRAAIGRRLQAWLRTPDGAMGDAGDELPGRFHYAPTFGFSPVEALAKISTEFLMPGADAIDDDTIGLVETNPAFVEAFLLGANDELARELLWREFPADLRETWLPRFWDYRDSERADIEPVADWKRRVLGTHSPAGAGSTLVLVLRSALLRRYPDTIIEAVKGKWEATSAGSTVHRVEDTSIAGLKPTFEGRLGNGLAFFGFDLDEDSARGDASDGGWFFVFAERPSAPRFGLDIEPEGGRTGRRRPTLRFWKDLTWAHLDDAADVAHVDVGTSPSARGLRYDAGYPIDRWGDDAAAMARITLQRPVRMLVHATALLPETPS